jgi:hypothetical protein
MGHQLRRAVLPVLLLLSLIPISRLNPPTPAVAQAPWAAEPTYRFAGHYEGEWSTDVAPEPAEAATGSRTVFDQQPGDLRGRLAVDVACDGTVSGQAQAQTQTPIALAAIVDGPEGPRVLSASLDVVAATSFTGTLARRAADGPSSTVDAALAGVVRDLPTDVESAAVPTRLERYYTGGGSLAWGLLEGIPGRLAGAVTTTLDLTSPTSADEPPLTVKGTGRWVVARVAAALCPWQATVSVSGAVANEQLHDERSELTFSATPDGRLEGAGRGQATIRGGPAGGCTYSGGGPFAVLVAGEAADGRFRLRLEDFEQAQLLVTTTCPTGRYVAPLAPLTPHFGPIELPEQVGAQVQLTLPSTVPDARGTLDVTISPVVGAAPP